MWDDLNTLAAQVGDRHILDLFDATRADDFAVQTQFMRFDYAKTNIDSATRDALLALADAAGVSARQLNRLFTDKLGRPTMRYYRELRLDKAQSLLRNSPLSLTEIALATGFANSSHFSRAYTAQFGQPPSSYR